MVGLINSGPNFSSNPVQTFFYPFITKKKKMGWVVFFFRELPEAALVKYLYLGDNP